MRSERTFKLLEIDKIASALAATSAVAAAAAAKQHQQI